MTFMTGEEKLVTSDARGRVLVSKERREALLEEFERSGLSGMRFAQLVGVKYSTFACWLKRRRDRRQGESGEGSGATGESLAFAEAVVDRSATTSGTNGGAGFTIELPGGARVEVQSPLQLRMAAELLRLLSAGGMRGC